MPVRLHGETMYWQANANTPLSVTPLLSVPGKSAKRPCRCNVQQTRIYPYPLGARSARPNPKMGAPDPENPLFVGLSVLRGGLRKTVKWEFLGSISGLSFGR